jgi:soluble lytic murein transglycosylase-like protein
VVNDFNKNHNQIGKPLLSFNEALEKYNQLKLVDKAAKADVQVRPLSVDSVAKFVSRENIQKYFRLKNLPLNYVEGEHALNRLRALTKTGEEYSNDRFNIRRTSGRSLNALANYFGVIPGDYETNPQNTRAFFKLFKEDIQNASEKYNIDPIEFASLIKHESGGFSFAISTTGASGAAQLTSYIYDPKQGSSLDETKNSNPVHPLDAIDRSAEYLGYLKEKYRRFDDQAGTLRLAAYNQGEPVVDRALNIARSHGVRNPTQVLNFINPENNSYVVSAEGRGFPRKVRAEKRHMNLYIQEFLANN